MTATDASEPNEMFAPFIVKLLLGIRAHGGHATYDPSTRTGTFVEFLIALREHLPDGFVPDPLPFDLIGPIYSQFTNKYGPWEKALTKKEERRLLRIADRMMR